MKDIEVMPQGHLWDCIISILHGRDSERNNCKDSMVFFAVRMVSEAADKLGYRLVE